jgi:hypothetical protein
VNTVQELWKDAMLDVGLGRRYGHTGDETQDCVRILYAALEVMYPDVDVAAWHKPLHLAGYPLGSFANIEATVQLGVGRSVVRPEPGSVVLVQEWWKTGGHAYSHLEPESPDPRPGYILHATTAPDWYGPHDLWARLKGKQYRMAQLIHPHDVR